MNIGISGFLGHSSGNASIQPHRLNKKNNALLLSGFFLEA